jgi:hypothetical protein
MNVFGAVRRFGRLASLAGVVAILLVACAPAPDQNTGEQSPEISRDANERDAGGTDGQSQRSTLSPPPGDSAELDSLWLGCQDGDFVACDDLFLESPSGSSYETFGDTCGYRNDPSGYCEDLYGGASGSAGDGDYGSDSYLDRLWDECSLGDFISCDDLYLESPAGSTYEEFGDTCGDRNDPAGYCEDLYGGNSPSAAYGDYGSDSYLDRLWDECDGGDFVSCDDLYEDSPAGSEYEYFGDTCGYRNEPSDYCEFLYW